MKKVRGGGSLKPARLVRCREYRRRSRPRVVLSLVGLPNYVVDPGVDIYEKDLSGVGCAAGIGLAYLPAAPPGGAPRPIFPFRRPRTA